MKKESHFYQHASISDKVIDGRVVLGSQIISQLFYYNSDVAKMWVVNYHLHMDPLFFSLPITFCHVTVMTKSCEKLCGTRFFVDDMDWGLK